VCSAINGVSEEHAGWKGMRVERSLEVEAFWGKVFHVNDNFNWSTRQRTICAILRRMSVDGWWQMLRKRFVPSGVSTLAPAHTNTASVGDNRQHFAHYVSTTESSYLSS
jgi:hypothetical protein